MTHLTLTTDLNQTFQGIEFYDNGIYDEVLPFFQLVTQAISDTNNAKEKTALIAKYATDYNSKGVAYEAEVDIERAIANYSLAIALNPEYATAYYNRSKIRKNEGDSEGATDDFNKAIALNTQYSK
ncbi:MAG: hypothetical protein GY928_36160 [Colwellia sp.]|nr:hypothetical protein [Colwellia sp.]